MFCCALPPSYGVSGERVYARPSPARTRGSSLETPPPIRRFGEVGTLRFRLQGRRVGEGVTFFAPESPRATDARMARLYSVQGSNFWKERIAREIRRLDADDDATVDQRSAYPYGGEDPTKTVAPRSQPSAPSRATSSVSSRSRATSKHGKDAVSVGTGLVSRTQPHTPGVVFLLITHALPP